MKTELSKYLRAREKSKSKSNPRCQSVYNKVSQNTRNRRNSWISQSNAPVDVVRLRYKNEIRQDVLQELLAPKVTEAIQQHELTPLGRTAASSR